MKERYTKYVVWFSVAMIAYLLSVSIPETILIQNFTINQQFHPTHKVLYLLTLLFIASTASSFLKFRFKRPVIVIVVVGLLALSLGTYRQLNAAQHNMLHKPYITSINKTSFIQGDTVEIDGRGFGDAWVRGNVYLGDMLLTVQSWSNFHIEAKVPVPESYFSDDLYVVTNEDKRSNEVTVSVLDPAEVLR